VRNSLCNDILGLPRDQVRVTVGDVGGGFGMKTGIYPEDAAVAWCRPHAASARSSGWPTAARNS
jgi:CO/xanthine dehydrogenase Mo-binding subunit